MPTASLTFDAFESRVALTAHKDPSARHAETVRELSKPGSVDPTYVSSFKRHHVLPASCIG